LRLTEFDDRTEAQVVARLGQFLRPAGLIEQLIGEIEPLEPALRIEQRESVTSRVTRFSRSRTRSASARARGSLGVPRGEQTAVGDGTVTLIPIAEYGEVIPAWRYGATPAAPSAEMVGNHSARSASANSRPTPAPAALRRRRALAQRLGDERRFVGRRRRRQRLVDQRVGRRVWLAERRRQRGEGAA
jgi:hypothetical protein